MIDIHSHILFEMDDGSKSLDESIKLCRDAYENGYKVMTCTPHFHDYQNIDDFVILRQHRFNILKDALKKENIPLKLTTGAEVFLHSGIFDAPNLDAITLNYSRYLLCEFPLGPFDLDEGLSWIDELIDRGYYPILAHPERYYEFHMHPQVVKDLLERRVLFQVNFNSLAGVNTKEIQNAAVQYVKNRIALFIALDAHDTKFRHTRISERVKDIPNDITEEMIRDCMFKFPKIILSDKNIFDYVN